MSLPSLSNAGPGSPDQDSKRYFDEQHENVVVRKTLEERQAQLQEALKIDPGVRTWSAAAFYVRYF
jgi:thymidylate synthase ThyX